jgi:uncharacterized membrane protein YvbJ
MNHVKCKICGSTQLREKYGKMECEQCGARFTVEQIQREVKGTQAPKASGRNGAGTTTSPSGGMTAGKRTALLVAAAVIIVAVAVVAVVLLT